MRHKNQSCPLHFTLHGAVHFALLLFLSVPLVRCTSPENRLTDEAMRYDFFNTEDGIRIVGRAAMPEGSLSESYEDRKARCIESARQHANSKWLGLTEKAIELQTLWHHRLQKGARGPWQRCFDEATMLRYIPAGESCSVVMLYKCDPRDW